MICPLHAWGDESIRSHGLDAPAYLLGASIVDTDDVVAARDLLESLRVEHGDPKHEPMLWLPDQVLGMLGESLSTGRQLPGPIADGIQTFGVRP
ncbi:hypothetical protein ACRQ4B_04555 [Curtobacterium sp. SP.BCo]|uniref:hypothetical protein n=1 Tax=Curtobacterium sp. SP.BCo TaxID=3435229 RepID=UPI003F732AB8